MNHWKTSGPPKKLKKEFNWRDPQGSQWDETVIYMAKNARGKTTSAGGLGPNLQIQYVGHIPTLLRPYETIVRSFCDLLDMLFISTTKTIERCKRNSQ